MSLQIRKLSYALGAEISGVDITKPLTDAAFGRGSRERRRHSVLEPVSRL